MDSLKNCGVIALLFGATVLRPVLCILGSGITFLTWFYLFNWTGVLP